MAATSAPWLRTGVDYAAPVLFVATLLITRDFQRATWVLVGASAIALAVGWAVERRLAPLPLFAGLAALIFGGLTLVFHDKSFVKMKLTFVDGALGLAMFGGLVLGKNPLKALLGEAVRLPDAAWRTLTVRYGLFFLVCAVCNEAVWRTQSDARWGVFRLLLLAAALVFSGFQAPFMMRHMQEGAAEPTPEPPDPGF
jgi:intracellular septation protein